MSESSPEQAIFRLRFSHHYICYGGTIMDYKDLNAFEIVERSIMQCKEENESLLTHESVDFFMQSGLNDDM